MPAASGTSPRSTYREVHADDVQARLAEAVDGLDRVGLGSDGADDGGAAEVPLRLDGGVEVGEPGDGAANFEMILRRGHCVDGCFFASIYVCLSRTDNPVDAEAERRVGSSGWEAVLLSQLALLCKRCLRMRIL